MNIFVAGATGALGAPLVRALVARGHAVTGLTRQPSRAASLRGSGARVAIADALDAPSLARVVGEASPDVVVHALTALPPAVLRARDLAATNHLRRVATPHLLRAAIDACARRVVVESFMAVYGVAPFIRPATEDEPLPDAARGPLADAVLALREMETHARMADAGGALETVVLRYAGFYGPRVGGTELLVQQIRTGRLFAPAAAEGILSYVHIDDAVSATVAAIERARPGPVYNVADDDPMPVQEFLAVATAAFDARPPRRMPAWLLRVAAPVAHQFLGLRLPLSNALAKHELGWTPRVPSARDGWRQLARTVKTVVAA